MVLSRPLFVFLFGALALAPGSASGIQDEARVAEVEAQSHNNLGIIAEHEGKLQEALFEYRKALEIWPQANQPAMEAQTLCNLGQLLLTIGQTQDALNAFNRALALLRREDRQDVHFEVLDGAGLAHQDLGNRGQALLMYELAVKRAKTPTHQARIRHRLGIVYRDERDYEGARLQLEQSRQIAHDKGIVRWEAYALADLAHLDDLVEQNEAALAKFDKAYALLAPLPERLAKASILFGRAEVLRDLGRLEEAVASVTRSIQIVEPVRANLKNPRERVHFFSWRQRYHELYITLLMDLHRRKPNGGWEIKAFAASDQSRSRSLLDDVAGEPGLVSRSLAQIQSELLDPETALLAYALGDRGSFLWVVNQKRVSVFPLPNRADVEKVAIEGRSRLFRSGVGPEIEALSRMLLPDGVEPLLRRRLLVSPDGALHAIPFAMLRGKRGRQLVFDHVVTSLPSATYLVGMRHKLAARPLAPKQLAVLADPVFEPDDVRLSHLGRVDATEPFGGHLDRLLFSRNEAKGILRLVPNADKFEAFDFEASRSTALSPEMSLYRMIHITTHHIEGDHPDFAGLVLSRFDKSGRSQEGLLRASEIYQMRLPAELVVLSACGSGLGPRVRGEGPMGLTRAFLHAGAKRVLVSLWDVEENATTELMTRFYGAMLRDKLSPSDALQSAQLSMANDSKWSSSRAWAAFVLQGEPR